mgnify:CR=1 FL=1
MSPSAFAIIFLKTFKEVAGASVMAVLLLLFRDDDDKSVSGTMLAVAAILGCTAVISLLVAFFKYYFRKFHIQDGKLIFTSGFASKRTTNIPLSRVHTLRTKRGLFYRLLDLRGVSFDTLATELEEVELILDEDDWQMLLRRVGEGENNIQPTDPSMPPPVPENLSVLNIRNSDLIKGALCQNHLKGFAVLAAIVLPLIDNLNQFAGDATGRMLDYVEYSVGNAALTVWQWTILAIAIYLFVAVLWIGKVILLYGNMKIKMSGPRLTVESGLISRLTSRFANNKVTVLTVKQNPFEKIAGCCTVTLRQASNVIDPETKGKIRFYGWKSECDLLAWWLGDSGEPDSPAVMEAKSGSGVFAFKFFPRLLVAAVAAVAIYYFSLSPVIAVSVATAYTIFAAVLAAMAWKHSGIRLTGTFVEIGRGEIAVEKEYIRYADIESISIRATPFTPLTRRVALEISTNAGAVTVRSLPLDSVLLIRSRLLK